MILCCKFRTIVDLGMFIRRFIILFFIFLSLTSRAEAIKIGLVSDAKSVKIAASVSAEIYDSLHNKLLYEIRPMKLYEFKSNNGELSVIANKQKIDFFEIYVFQILVWKDFW